MKKLSNEKKCYLILLAFILIAFIIFIPVSAVFSMWGLTIGWILGGATTLISQFLIFKSGRLIADSAKDSGKGTGLTLLFYFSRFLIYAASLILCACMDYLAHSPFFKWSIFTCVGALLPSTLIITIFYHEDDEIKEDKTTNK